MAATRFFNSESGQVQVIFWQLCGWLVRCSPAQHVVGTFEIVFTSRRCKRVRFFLQKGGGGRKGVIYGFRFFSKFDLLEMGANGQRGVDHPVGKTPFVVVPGHDPNEFSLDYLSFRQVEHQTMGVMVEIG